MNDAAELLEGKIIASYPGHSHVFNVTRRKGGGPG